MRAFEILEEPKYMEPTETELPLHLLKKETVVDNNGVEVDSPPVEDLEYDIKFKRYRMLTNMYSCDQDK